MHFLSEPDCLFGKFLHRTVIKTSWLGMWSNGLEQKETRFKRDWFLHTVFWNHVLKLYCGRGLVGWNQENDWFVCTHGENLRCFHFFLIVKSEDHCQKVPTINKQEIL